MRYRRAQIEGAAYFFKVNLADRPSRLLVDSVGDLREVVRYTHFNPVKHGYVRRAVDWPFSSFHRYLRIGWVDPDWGCADGFPGDFGERR